mgnify:CR=1 FL=1
MHVTVRNWAAVGVPVLIAGAVALAPVTVPAAAPPTIVVPAIELAALPTWLQWVDTGTTALGAQVAAVVGGVQNEVQHPVPILGAMVRNQLINAQNVGGALVNSAQALAGALVSLPQQLVNAALGAITNPLTIPVVLPVMWGAVVSAATAVLDPIRVALTNLATTTFGRATGVFNAVVANIGPIVGALINIPTAVGGAVLASALSVAGSVVSLNPFNVIGAVGDGLVNVETTAFNAAAGVATAVGNMRRAVAAAVAYPLPAPASALTPAAAAAVGGSARTSHRVAVPRAAVAAGKTAPRASAAKPRSARP